MFGKSQAKQSSHSSIDHIISHYIPQSVSEFVVKYPKTSYFFVIFQCRNSSLTKTTDSCSFLLKKYLTVVNLTLLYLSTIPSCMSAAGEETSETSQKQAIAFDENFFGTFSALCLSFVFFVFVFWPIETTAVNLQGLGH